MWADAVEHFRTHGWVLVPGVVPTEEIDAAARELAPWTVPPDTAADPGDVGRRFRAGQFVGLTEFPLGPLLLDRLPVHPRVLELAAGVLGTEDVRLYQAELFVKVAGTANFEQPLHMDLHNHTALPLDERWPQTQFFLYLTDVDEPLGPTHVVSQTLTREIPPPGSFLPDGRYDHLYDHESVATGPRGSVLAYRGDTVHRGVDMTAGTRVTFNLGYRAAGADWVGANPWPRKGVAPSWAALVESCAPAQLNALGFPPPGHPYWTEANLAATHVRYPRLDLAPYRSP
jgi:hypothetical protein